MHVPDGFIDAPTSAVTCAIAVTAVGVSLRAARNELAERTAPLGGLVAAFVFAVQLISVPIAGGTSAHVLGGLFAAIVVGPYTALLCTSIVLLVQSLVLAYGGLSALGASMISMDLVPILSGYCVFLLLRAVMPMKPRAIVASSAIAAFISAPAGAVAFTVIYAIGGISGIQLSTVLTAVVGGHILVGVIEAVVTAFAISSLLATRPDLIRAARSKKHRVVVGLSAHPVTGIGSELLQKNPSHSRSSEAE